MKKMNLLAAVCAMLGMAAVVVSNFHGGVPPPDDGTGNVVLAHGGVPPPDDGTGNIV